MSSHTLTRGPVLPRGNAGNASNAIIFENDRFVAPEAIGALAFIPDGRLLAITNHHALVFDVESGARVLETKLTERGLYRGGLSIAAAAEGTEAGAGAAATPTQALVHGAATGPLIVLDIRADAIGHRAIAEIEEEADDASAAITARNIVFAQSVRARVFDHNGNTTKEIPGPFDSESRVTVSPRGRYVVWELCDRAKDSAIEIHEVETGKTVRIAIGGGGESDSESDSDTDSDSNSNNSDRIYGDIEISSDDRLIAVPVQTNQWRLEIRIFDLASGASIAKLVQRGTREDVTLTFSPDNQKLIALVGATMQCWSIHSEGAGSGEILWTSVGWGRLGGLAIHPNGDRIAVARGQRITFVDLARGTRIGLHEGPALDVQQVMRDSKGRVVVRDGIRAYVIERGRVRSEIDAWSCHLDDGDLYIYTYDGTLLRVGDDAEEPIIKPLLRSKGRPTRIDLRGDRMLYPDPNADEPLHLAHRSTMSVTTIGTQPIHEACFAGDDTIAVTRVTHDAENDYRLVQSMALWRVLGADDADAAAEDVSSKWEKPIGGETMIELLGANRSGVAIQKGNAVIVFGIEDGAVLAELGFDAAPAGAVFLGDDVFVLGPNGALHRISLTRRPTTAGGGAGAAGAGDASKPIADLGAGATAFHLDADGRGLVAFGCRSIVEIDLRDLGVASLPRAAHAAAASGEKKKSSQRLFHRFNHETEVSTFALSPDGSLLATGSWVGDDYDRGGTLQIWDVRTGRVLNVLDPIEGGVGWPDYAQCIKWSPSGRSIAMAFNTNGIGIFTPFAEAPIPRMVAYTTDGWSRPPGFQWSHHEDRIAISSWNNDRSFIPMCVVDASQRRVEEATARWFAKTDADPASANANANANAAEFKDAARELYFSPDDTILCAHNGGHGEAWAVDLATGKLRYRIKTDGGQDFAWSACGRYLACTTETQVIFYSVEAGNQLATTDLGSESGASLLAWSNKGSRLAVASEDALLFFEGTTLLGSHDVALQPDRDFDASCFVWSPDGTHAAWVADGKLQVWSIAASNKMPSNNNETKELKQAFTTEVSAGVRGLFWNADDAIVCVGRSVFEVVTLDSSLTKGTRVFTRDLSMPTELMPDTPSPLVVDGEDLGATSFRLSPAFPLACDDGHTWGLAFETGQVVCPTPLRDQLEGALSPYSSGSIEIYDDLAEALPHLPLSASIKEKLALAASVAAASSPEETRDVLPLRRTTQSFEDLTELHWDTIKDLSSGWETHSSEALHEAAVIHARRGDVEAALRNARRVPQVHDRAMALADCASWLAKTSPAIARELLHEAVALVDEVTTDPWRAFVNADVGAAHSLLGDSAKAEACFAIAETATVGAEESNIFQNHAHLAAAYLRAGDVARAKTAIDRGPWDSGYLHIHLPKYIAYAAESGFVDHALELAHRCREEMGEVDWSTIEVLSAALIAADRHADLLKWLSLEHNKSTTKQESAAIDDLIAKGRVEEAVAHLSAESIVAASASAAPPVVSADDNNKEEEEEEDDEDDTSDWDYDGSDGLPWRLARRMKTLAKYSPGSVPGLLEQVLRLVPSLDGIGVANIVGDVAEAMARIGHAQATSVLEKGLGDDELFHLYCGLARGGDVSAVAKALAFARGQNEPRARLARLSELARALSSAAIFDEARAIGTEHLRGNDRRYALGSLMVEEIGAGELEGAYRTWHSLSKHHREYEVSRLISGLAEAGEIDATMHVLRQLSRKNDMNGLPQEVMRAIRHVSRLTTAIV